MVDYVVSGTTPLQVVNIAGGSLPGVYSVNLYGAVGDGVTNDTTAIQSAISAAAVTGGVVYFPPTSANYKITSTLSIPAKVSFEGYANGASTISLSGASAGTAALKADSVNNWAIRNLTITSTGDGIQVGSTSGVNFGGVIENVWITSLAATGKGIRISPHATVSSLDVYDLKLSHVLINPLGASLPSAKGFAVDSGTAAGLLFCTWVDGIVGNIGIGIELTNAVRMRGYGLTFYNNANSGNGRAIRFLNTVADNVFHGCHFEGGTIDVYVEASSGTYGNKVEAGPTSVVTPSQISDSGTANELLITGTWGGGSGFNPYSNLPVNLAGVAFPGSGHIGQLSSGYITVDVPLAIPGANPTSAPAAHSGDLRLYNGGIVSQRNTSNNGDLNIISGSAGTNRIIIGDANTELTLVQSGLFCLNGAAAGAGTTTAIQHVGASGGASASSTGDYRVNNTWTMKRRNSANNADVYVLVLNSDIVEIGSPNDVKCLIASPLVDFQGNTVTAGSPPGTGTDLPASSIQGYLHIQVGGTDYYVPLVGTPST